MPDKRTGYLGTPEQYCPLSFDLFAGITTDLLLARRATAAFGDSIMESEDGGKD